MAPSDGKKRAAFDASGASSLYDEGRGRPVLEYTGPEWMKEVANTRKIIDSYSAQKREKITNERYLNYGSMEGLRSQIESVVPKEERGRFYKALGYINSDAEKALKLVKGYQAAGGLLAKKLVEYGRKVHDPVERHRQEAHIATKLGHEIQELNMRKTDYMNKLGAYEKRIEEHSQELRKVLDQYKNMKETAPEKESRTGNAVLIALTSAFGLSVMWALSRTDPGTVTVGAFIEGGASPVLLSMLTATVIFLFVFLSHHKLR